MYTVTVLKKLKIPTISGGLTSLPSRQQHHCCMLILLMFTQILVVQVFQIIINKLLLCNRQYIILPFGRVSFSFMYFNNGYECTLTMANSL